eukprot:47434-Prorocentrum_minimum.AAC.3
MSWQVGGCGMEQAAGGGAKLAHGGAVCGLASSQEELVRRRVLRHLQLEYALFPPVICSRGCKVVDHPLKLSWLLATQDGEDRSENPCRSSGV